MKNGDVDLRFAPAVAVLSGLIGGLLAIVARHGWQFAWPAIGLLAGVGIALIFVIQRQPDHETSYWTAVIATSLALTSVVAAGWGIAGGVGL
jgi:hypothetical protein